MTITNLDDDLAQYTNPVLDGDFQPPTTPTELLERGLAMAEEEGKWYKGGWFSRKFSSYSYIPDAKISCSNVSACAMGILVLARADGPAIRAYFSSVGMNIQEICGTDPLIEAAAGFLAMGLDDARGHGVDRWSGHEAINHVISVNDSRYTDENIIVRGFRRAVQMSTAAQA